MTTIHLVSEFDQAMVSIATHDGVFHADDVMAVAIIQMAMNQPIQLIRTRQPELLTQATFAVDVGGTYDPESGRFDHHQVRGGVKSERFGFEGCAAAGLVWDWFGPRVVANHFSEVHSLAEGVDMGEIVKEVYASLIRDIDAIDCGNRRPAEGEYSFSHAISAQNPTWELGHDTAFLSTVEWVQRVIGAEINKAVARLKDKIDAEKVFADSERVAVFPRYLEGWQDIVPERIQRVVFPRLGGGWSVQRPEGRVDLPTQDEARTLLGEDLVFVHANRFIGAAKTQSGAITLAHYGL